MKGKQLRDCLSFSGRGHPRSRYFAPLLGFFGRPSSSPDRTLLKSRHSLMAFQGWQAPLLSELN
jgi:hypothetical protein